MGMMIKIAASNSCDRDKAAADIICSGNIVEKIINIPCNIGYRRII